MGAYRLIDGTSGVDAEIEAGDMAEAKRKADAWMREAQWDMSEGTIWVRVHVIDLSAVPESDDPRDHAETLTITIQPPEPECTEAEHDWQAPVEIVGGIASNPGVWGHGGGVVIHECCMHCGCERVTDTWAQDPETGRQGLESVRYEAGKYTAQLSRGEEEE